MKGDAQRTTKLSAHRVSLAHLYNCLFSTQEEDHSLPLSLRPTICYCRVLGKV